MKPKEMSTQLLLQEYEERQGWDVSRYMEVVRELVKRFRRDEQFMPQLLSNTLLLARIYEYYLQNLLEECRPEWRHGLDHDLKTELFNGRGGKRIITLQDCCNAHDLITTIYQEEKSNEKEIS